MGSVIRDRTGRTAMEGTTNPIADVTEDPLIALLRRYEVGLKAFNETGTGERDDEYWDRLANETWHGAQQDIILSKPTATTSTSALMALDHVLRSEELFGDLSESADQQMLWQLVKAARDYVASLVTPSL
jgi:hypothetical protein